jgi:cytochrome c
VLKGLLLGVTLTLLVLGLVRWWGEGPMASNPPRGAGPTTSTGAPPQPELSEEQLKALFHARRCTNCHDMRGTLLGPAVIAIAERYRDQPGAVERLVRSVREGSQGAWGDTPMPMHQVQRLSVEDAERLVRWVLAQ